MEGPVYGIVGPCKRAVGPAVALDIAGPCKPALEPAVALDAAGPCKRTLQRTPAPPASAAGGVLEEVGAVAKGKGRGRPKTPAELHFRPSEGGTLWVRGSRLRGGAPASTTAIEIGNLDEEKVARQGGARPPPGSASLEVLCNRQSFTACSICRLQYWGNWYTNIADGK